MAGRPEAARYGRHWPHSVTARWAFSPACRSPSSSTWRGRSCADGQRERGLVVIAEAHLPGLEDPVLGDPVKGPFKGLSVVGLEHDPLARPPAPRVHRGVECFRKLALVVMRVE